MSIVNSGDQKSIESDGHLIKPRTTYLYIGVEEGQDKKRRERSLCTMIVNLSLNGLLKEHSSPILAAR